MANIFQDNNIIYKYNRNKDNSIVLPKIFLRTRTLKKIGIISPVFDLKINTNFNEANTCSFTIYKNNNGIEKPIFNRIKNLSIIEIEGFGLFEINVKTIDDNVTYKNISGTSLQESELGQYDCTLEINTESDIERPDYDKNYPTIFYRDLSLATSDTEREKMCQSSLLHRILTYAPTYNIGHVDDSLKGINREFSCSDSNVYDFLQDIAEEVGCIFIFNPNSREINAYDLEDHCLKCGGRHIINGVCQNCKEEGIIEHGYGLDTSIYVDTKTIAESIEDSVDVGNVKNCFKLVAGDDEITNRIGQRLIGNSNYLWTFGDDQIQEFSEALREKWINYADYVNTFQSEFDSLWDSYNENLNKISDYQYGMMPVSEQTIGDNPTQTCQDIFTDIQTNIPYYVIGAKNAVKSTVQSNILKYCNYICRQGYTVEYQKDTSGQPIVNVETTRIDNMDVITKFSAKLYIYVPSCKDENDNDKYYYKSNTWTINVLPGYDKIDSDNSEVFTHNYYLYLKQMIDLKMAKSDITFNPKYDTDYDDKTAHPDDPYYYKNLFREYAIERLNSFLDAYDSCVVILSELDSDLATSELQRSYNYLIDDKGTVSTKTMYETLIEKFTAFSVYIRNILAEYEGIVKDLESKNEEISNNITEINTKCNIKNYLGESLYNELISFKREQTYENQNFTSDVVDEATLMNNVEEFLVRAKEEIAKSCQFQHSVPISMANLLTLTDFEKVFNVFALGNYMRTRINGELVKLRIISIPFDFENIETCEVTFSDALVGNQKLKDFQKKTQKASSMATSFDYVQKQSTQNDKQISTFSQIFNEGLDATKTMIMSADDITTVMDGHGILTRHMNMDTGEYSPEQMRITNGTMGFTDDNWNTIKTAFGKFWWNGSYRYGLIGESIIGQILAGENLIIANNDNSVIIDGDGIYIEGGYLNITNGNKQVIVDPSNQTKTGYIFAVKNGTEFTVGIKADGTTNIKGHLTALSLDLNGNKISSSDINDLDSTIKGYGYQTANQTKSIIEAYGYQTSSNVKSIVTSYGYQNANEVKSIVEGYGYTTNSSAYQYLLDGKYFLVSGTKLSEITGYTEFADSLVLKSSISSSVKTEIITTPGGVTKERTVYTTTIPNSDGTSKTFHTYDDGSYILTNIGIGNGSSDPSTSTSTDTYVMIDKNGCLTADNAVVRGSIYATNGYFSGELRAATGSFTGSINVNNKFKVDSEGNVTLPSGTKLSWTDVTGTDNIATKNYVTSQGYETATSIKNTVITKDYIETLNIKAGSVDAENISGTTISGKTISGGTITQDNGYYSVTLNDGYLKIGKVVIFNGLLNYNSSQKKYSNAINFGCDNYTGEVGMRWQDDTVRLIGNPSKLWLGESSYPIGKMYMSGEITGNWKDSSDSLKITGCSSASIGTISGCTSLSMSSGRITGCSSASIITINSNAMTPMMSSSTGIGNIGSSSYPYANIYVKTAHYDNQTTLSDKRMKKDIMPLNNKFAVDFINAQRIMTYNYTYEDDMPTRYGMVAQDVEETLLNMGLTENDFVGLHTPNDENKYYGLDYTTFIPLLISYCQSLYQDLSACKQEIKTLQNSLSKFCEVDK